MAIEFQTFMEKSLSRGIDARSAETQIQPGFVSDLINGDVIEGRVKKRVGYQGFAGDLPVRVTTLEYSAVDQTITFSFGATSTVNEDIYIDLSNVRSTPIVVYGRSTLTSGIPFNDSGDEVRYYPAFTVPLRYTFDNTVYNTPGPTITIAQNIHALSSINSFIAVTESTTTYNLSHITALPHEITMDSSTLDVSVDYYNNTGIDRDVFIYYEKKEPSTGSVYVTNFSHTGSGQEVLTIPPATHALDDYSIICQVQEYSSTTYKIVKPDKVTISPTGTVEITLNSSIATTYHIILSITPAVNRLNGNIASMATQTVTLSSTSPWIFPAIYVDNITSLELIYPDSVQYDADTQEFTITFSNGSNTALNFIIYYEFGLIRTNRLRVDALPGDVITTSGTDTSPQLTVWGLRHSEIYGSNKSGKSGWVNWLDSLKKPLERRLLSGLGGNIFVDRSRSEAGTDYLYGLLHPDLQARTASAHSLGPVLWETGETPALTRGYITSDNSALGWGKVTSVTYQIGSGYTRYIVSLTNMAITGTPISTTTGLEDYLTIQQMSHSKHEGTFKIASYTLGVDQITFDVVNPNLSTTDYDDLGCQGDAGIFTDRITLTGGSFSPFLGGDTLSVPGISSDISVTHSLGYVTVVSNITEKIEIAANILVTGNRVSNIVPLREGLPLSTAMVDNIVCGDMLQYSDDSRLVEVIQVNSDITRDVSIVGTGGDYVTVVIGGGGDTSRIAPGYSILISNTGSSFDGPNSVHSVLNSTSFQIDNITGLTGTITGKMIGKLIVVDEQLPWSDSNRDLNPVSVEDRWIPVEAPDDSFNRTPDTHIRHLDTDSYTNQSPVRSTMVSDNMYLTNGVDEVQKMDGSSVYCAGLPDWQPGLFLTTDTTASAKIVVSNRSIPYSSHPSAADEAAGRLPIASSDIDALPIGTRVVIGEASGQIFTVKGYLDTGSSYYIYFDRALPTLSTSHVHTITELSTYRYYFRLNAVDINGNVIASASTGYQDHVVELSSDSAVNLKFTNFPVWCNFDFSHLDLQVYRTLKNGAAPFYLVANIPLSFNGSGDYYLSYTDTFSDADLSKLDPVNTALLGSEIGVGWKGPLRAKYITSIGNRLVLANVRDYPRLDMQMLSDANISDSTLSGIKFTLYRDYSDTASSKVNTFQLVNSGAVTVSSISSVANTSFTLTVSTIPTGLAAGDWIYLYYSTVATTGRNLTVSGWWKVDSFTSSPNTITILHSGAPASITVYPDRLICATDPTDVPVLLGVDGNLGMANGDSTFNLFDAGRRLGMAINSVMSQSSSPLCMARSGNDTGASGRVLISQPRSDVPTMALEIEDLPSAVQLFVNDISYPTGSLIPAATKLFPSRVVVSYENYPEIFDNPTAVLDTQGTSIFDINSADGQEITGVIPFFGQAAFGAAQQSGVLVVFKSNSIYLVDINEKLAGRNYLQKLETTGVGCTAPYSVADTKNGIMFAFDSGIYNLRRNQSVEYVGRFMERNWIEKVNRNALELCQGHHYSIGRKYMLSVPLTTDDFNSEVYVYNHTEETEGSYGAWGRYTNYFATGWANLDSDEFHSSTSGRVFSTRKSGTETDFRDSSTAIIFTLDTRHIDFGNASIRKIVDHIIVYYRTMVTSNSTQIYYSTDTNMDFIPSTRFTLRHANESTGIDDRSGRLITQIKHNTSRRKCAYMQVRITCDDLDVNVEIAGIDFIVGGLNSKGLLHASDSN
jgi:hypothetical protein